MAVVLRSNSDLIYLPDHGFVGEDGALRILINITRQIHRLDISHNFLGREGIATLIQGLTSIRTRYATNGYKDNIWGIKELNLGSNGIDDEALSNILGYAKKDVCLRKVFVQGNVIELRDHLDSVINSLNSSRLSTFSLTNNELNHESVLKWFTILDSSHLTELYVSTCGLPTPTAAPIAEYLSSPRSRNLELLELNGNNLGVEAVTRLVDVIEHGNFTIKQLGLLANESTTINRIVDDGDFEQVRPTTISIEKENEIKSLSYQVHDRLPPLLERNRLLTRRIRRATLCALVPCRILLTARCLTVEETARSVIRSVGSRSTSHPFPILDLPREVLYLIARHCSNDPTAFSGAQFARLVAETEDNEGIKRLKHMVDDRVRKAEWGEETKAVQQAKEDWLRKGRWDKWELTRPRKIPKLTGHQTHD